MTVHILRWGLALCGAGMPLDWPQGDRWVPFRTAGRTAMETIVERSDIDCAPCLVTAGQRFPDEWPELEFGPDGVRCLFCGKWGDESTMDAVSGDGWGCPDCVDGYQRGEL